MAGEKDPLEDGQDPETDTQDDTPEDKASDADQSDQVDWKAKAEKLEKDQRKAAETIARQGTQLGQLRAALKGDEPAEAGDGDDPGVDRLRDDSWELAKAVHGEKAVAAYDDAYYPIYEAAQTPADHVAALVAFAKAYNEGPSDTEGGETETDDDGRQTREQALQPRVDPNRSDASPDSDRQSEAGLPLEAVIAGRMERRWGLPRR